jgi:hypothetical protein
MRSRSLGQTAPATAEGCETFTGRWRIVACLNAFDTQAGGIEMKFILMAFVTAGFIGSSTLALADSPVSAEEAAKIKAAIEVLGCTGGKMEKETEGSGYFEVDDAKCRDGQYDIKLDKDFKVIVMTRD